MNVFWELQLVALLLVGSFWGPVLLLAATVMLCQVKG